MHRFIIRLVTFYSKHPKLFLGCLALLIWYYFSLPNPLFNDPTSTVLLSRDKELLNAKIAEDGQWRFPEIVQTPEKFEICITQFEDSYFDYHWGFNPVSMVKALYKNVSSNKIKRGGSTITQQVIRLSRKNKKRTYFEKVIELILATRLEFSKSKQEILNYYSSYAPFGGNVVGLEAASWRYFNRSSKDLSWAETATLAVLPNAPSLIYPGKNQLLLKQKRNRLLKKLLDNNKLDSTTYTLSCLEELPIKPHPLPQIAPHLLNYISQTHKGEIYKSTINSQLQNRANTILKKHYKNRLKDQHIYNGSILIFDIETREVLAYVGNTPTSKSHNVFVDNIQSGRSTGSILKPFLYTAMFDEGSLLPQELIYDIPIHHSNFSPLNFDETFSGVSPANMALSQSLNVPAVHLLKSYNYHKFYEILKRLDFKHFNKPADNYGLSMILGGGECSLWDITKNYAGLSSILNRYDATIGNYASNEFCSPILKLGEEINFGKEKRHKTIFDAGSVYETFEALKMVNRPEQDASWQYYESAKHIAWKTGTSYGFRDAWAVGCTSKYAVGIWIGNSDGEGRPGITGVKASAPILFEVFDALPYSKWPQKPVEDMEEIELCTISGMLPNPNCSVIKKYIPKNGINGNTCIFHKSVHLNYELNKQVNRSCYPIDSIQKVVWFNLPPIAKWYYKKKNPDYKSLPPFANHCENGTKQSVMDFIYPDKNTKIYLPRNRFSEKSKVVITMAHSFPNKRVFWYLDKTFIGETQNFHSFEIQPDVGYHTLTLIDEDGNKIQRKFEIVE